MYLYVIYIFIYVNAHSSDKLCKYNTIPRTTTNKTVRDTLKMQYISLNGIAQICSNKHTTTEKRKQMKNKKRKHKIKNLNGKLTS